MNWNMKDLQSFQSKVINHKDEYMGERIGKYVFGGAGQKCIKLNGSTPEESEFISYADVLNEETQIAKDVFAFFFPSSEESEDAELIEINNLGDDFEDVIEDILLEKKVLNEDAFLFVEGITNVPLRSEAERVAFVKKECDFIFYDEKYCYFVKKDVTEDYVVERRKKSGFKSLF